MKLSDCVNGKEAHIVGSHETSMVQVILLLEYDFVAQLLRKPGYVHRDRKLIKIAREEHSRDVVVFEWHQWGLLRAVNFEVFLGTIVIQGELTRIDGLSIVNDGTVGLTGRRVGDHHLKPGHVVHRLINQKVRKFLTKTLIKSTDGVNCN